MAVVPVRGRFCRWRLPRAHGVFTGRHSGLLRRVSWLRSEHVTWCLSPALLLEDYSPAETLLPGMQLCRRSRYAAARLLQTSEVQPAVYRERHTVDECCPL